MRRFIIHLHLQFSGLLFVGYFNSCTVQQVYFGSVILTQHCVMLCGVTEMTYKILYANNFFKIKNLSGSSKNKKEILTEANNNLGKLI